MNFCQNRHARRFFLALTLNLIAARLLTRQLRETVPTREGQMLSALLPLAADFSRSTAALLSVCVVLPGLLLLGCALDFLEKRERRYRQTAEDLERFLEGESSRRLPRTETGGFGLLCAAADRLATALHARSETVRTSRDFLRRTISDISHQLKTPLAALELYRPVLAEEPDHPDTVREFAGRWKSPWPGWRNWCSPF